MSETVYIETSLLGYLTARPTKNLILAANIEVTRDWWEFRRSAFALYISQAVLNEVALGDSEIAAQRLESLGDFPLLELNLQVRDLAAQFSYEAIFLLKLMSMRSTLQQLLSTVWITC